METVALHNRPERGAGVVLSLDKIERLAPDQASLAAAKKLLKPGQWPTLQTDGSGLIWAECQGSGATPYRVALSEPDAGYKCTCPSRKFPCKHSLALMWLRADSLAPFEPGTPPEWVNDWLGRRRGAVAAKTGASDEPARPRTSIAALVEGEEQATEDADPQAAERAEAQRARNRARRETLVVEGLRALEQWIADQLERGLAGFDQRAAHDCATLARRLVDAKAGGLANRAALLPAKLFALPDEQRGLAAAEALAELYLIAQAYARQDHLPELLRADVRRAVGWTVTREALLEDSAAERVSGTWRVLAAREEVQPDRLRRIETWLECAERHAVLLDYVPVSGGASGNMYSPGEVLQAELAFYPSPVPLRAQIVRHGGTALAAAEWAAPARGLKAAVEAWQAAVAAKPWLGDWPLAAASVRIRASNGRLYVEGDGLALPVAAAQHEAARPLLELDTIALFGLWDGRALAPLLAATPLGEWTAP